MVRTLTAMTRHAALLALAAVVAACTSLPADRPAEPVSEKSVVLALLGGAENDMAAGRFDAAAASLERALRIEPRNAALWHELAKVRLQQGRFAQAAALATKSNALPGASNALKAANWRMIGEVRARQGDEPGARAAFAEAQLLQGL